MAASIAETLFAIGAIDDSALFSSLFAPSALQDTFDSVFALSASKGTDRRNGFQFVKPSATELPVVSSKCIGNPPIKK